ncbi:MAG: DUF2225 domain-containing protein, partial [Gemmatimonadota bacterium]|nr:DUF2225 domain-containing protein [Gemmatimonadota bacterium]
MNPEKSPFVKKKIPCPVCEARVENRFIMPKSYLEKNVESDRHVLEYKWLDEAFQGFHPPFYHFWHCPRCKYTATQNDFLKPTRDSGNNFAMIKRCLRNMSPANKETTDTLAHEINYEKMDFSVALNAHLLAVFIQELIPDKERNPSKLGSYWLRTAWLIREQKAGGDPGGLWAEQMKLLEKVAGTWPEAPHSEADCLKKAAAYYKTAYENHPRYDDMVKATDLMILIADVSFRAGDFKASMQSLNTVMQTGQKLRAKQQELIRREKEAGKLTLA